MKYILLYVLFSLSIMIADGQESSPNSEQTKAITSLIGKYSEAREKKDTILLKKILTSDIDQLVSSGEWRIGIQAAIGGMMNSSSNNPGTRTLTVEKIRMFGSTVAIADCRYEIQNGDGSIRKMWSSFFVVAENNLWKITAIRNMLPAAR